MPDEDFKLWVITEDIPAETAVPDGAREAKDIGGGMGQPAQGGGQTTEGGKKASAVGCASVNWGYGGTNSRGRGSVFHGSSQDRNAVGRSTAIGGDQCRWKSEYSGDGGRWPDQQWGHHPKIHSSAR